MERIAMSSRAWVIGLMACAVMALVCAFVVQSSAADVTPAPSVNTAMTSADETSPTLPVVRVPRNRPGRLARVPNMDELIRQGDVNDPLDGNYTLVNWDRIALSWPGTDNQPNTKVYSVTEGLGNPVARGKWNPYLGTGTVGLAVDVAAGFLHGDPAKMDIVSVFVIGNDKTACLDGSVRPIFQSLVFREYGHMCRT